MKLKYRVISLFIGIAGLSACSSIPKEDVDQRLAAWKGLHIDKLIKYWGLPTKQTQVDSKKYAEWINKSTEPGNASVSIGTGSHGRNSSIGIGVTLFDLGSTEDVCSRLVTYNESGTVTQISWQGTNNYCYEITPDFEKIFKKQEDE